jgi:hypothetical protein
MAEAPSISHEHAASLQSADSHDSLSAVQSAQLVWGTPGQQTHLSNNLELTWTSNLSAAPQRPAHAQAHDGTMLLDMAQAVARSMLCAIHKTR